jgi:hypothetical protein
VCVLKAESDERGGSERRIRGVLSQISMVWQLWWEFGDATRHGSALVGLVCAPRQWRLRVGGIRQ